MRYIAFLYKDSDIGYKDDMGYNVIIPDVEGCVTYGEDFNHALDMAQEALALALESQEALPIAHDLEYFSQKVLKELDIPSNAIPQSLSYNHQEKKRITINLHTKALNSIDNYMKRHGLKNRSKFLEESALMRVSN